ncbi:MAG TPA: histidine kinase, partial [Longimicrobiales bacterium]|nr:histidine kinase [Longimicrobiales bacterium]
MTGDTRDKAAPPGARWPIWKQMGLLLLLCLAVGLAEAVQVYSGNGVRGSPLTWKRAVTSVLPFWFTLGLLVPAVVWWSGRFRLDDAARRGRSLLAHVAGALAFALVHVTLASWLADYAFYRSFPLAFGENLWRLLSLHLITEVIFYWALVGAYYAVDFYRRYRERERDAVRLELEASRLEASLALANLQALRMQLHPHFLFNTLNAISTLALRGERQRVVGMLNRLSDLLRLTLETSAQLVPLRQELEMLQRYLEIEQVRFGDRLTVRVEAAPEVLDAEVPTLILQPL